MTKTVVALYDEVSAANQAVNELVNNGFQREDISVMTPDAAGEHGRQLENVDGAAAQGAGIGAGLGAALGGFGGLLVGLGALTIPGIGPVLAAGPLAAAVSGLAGAGVGAVAGGVTGGILGALVDMGVPEERANYYAEGLRRGGTLLVVRTDDERTRDAVDIVNRHQPTDLSERAVQWREAGWSHFDPAASAYTAGPGSTGRAGERRPTPASSDASRSSSSSRSYDYNVAGGVPAESRAYGMSGADDVDHGHGNTADKMGMAGDVDARDYGVAGSAPGSEGSRSEHGNTSEFMGMAGSTDQDYNDQVRHTDEHVHGNTAEYMGMAGSTTGYGDTPSTDRKYGSRVDYADVFDRYDARFRSYFASTPYATTYTYEEFLPAYRYGYDISREDRYRGQVWSDIEDDARRSWETDHPGTWERFKDSIRHAWEEFKDAVS